MIPLNIPIDKLVRFTEKNFPIYEGKSEEIRKIILTHIRYGTFDYLEENGKIIFVLRYNIEGDTAFVLDLAISKKHRRNIRFIKRIIARNWMRFPNVRYIKFERFKYPDKERKIYDLLKIMKIRS